MSASGTYNLFSSIKTLLRKYSGAGWRCGFVVGLMLCLMGIQTAKAQNFKRSDKQMVSGGLVQVADSLPQSNIIGVEVKMNSDSLSRALKLSAKEAQHLRDSISRIERKKERAKEAGRLDADGNIIPREPWFSDSMSLSRVCITGAVLPGFGQIYNKQYW